jgi:hypothetical protein
MGTICSSEPTASYGKESEKHFLQNEEDRCTHDSLARPISDALPNDSRIGDFLELGNESISEKQTNNGFYPA